VQKDLAILVIDDEQASRTAIARSLGNAGFDIVQSARGEDGLWAIDQHQFSCVLAEFRLPDIDGHAFIRQCHRIAPTLPLIVIGTAEDVADAAQCLSEGAASWLSKPLAESDVCFVVRQAIAKGAGRGRRWPVAAPLST
jgi:DNA-binding NtrC family response regulator